MSTAETLIPYHPAVNPVEYENLAIILLVIGFCMMSYFFIYQITYNKRNRSLSKEVIIGVFSSIFLALGTFFLFLALGFYL
ncbi:transmembrane protein, putative (macronuclear) [Tetrahymena thermophila SB210]|uniref:Dolichyl-diphosphooligosaccharide-protein glycosyltransferase subunit OST5 n=1 Tax=Tetrahymena thermophila (strain SB210) TaxID=312017 RepID=I7MEV3_TETTS|nr:transmembrane protein, putative [Tetrahymena thermophila SB210]EAR97863.1 transmembrane protein, putative [Tetrahymena thermophila SB210]|eukprot:XP_001018108.1 transmembrane protein, putative [Tetrahymena thermophila SB210]